MVDSLPLPPPQVPLFNDAGKPTQQGFEFLDRLQSLVKQLKAVTNIFDGLNATQSTALLDLFTSTLKGLVPLSGGGTANFLRADGTWAAPPTPASGGLTRITSVAAGTGTSLTITGLGGYKILWVFLRDVSHNNGTTSSALRVALSGNGGSSFGTPIPLGLALNFSNFYTAAFAISNCDQGNNQTVTFGQFFANASANLLTDTSSRGPIDALRFDFATSSNFDAGTFDIYGLK